MQASVFALVAAAFTNIYVTQPVLPLIEREFAASTTSTAWTVAAVMLGIALANLPFGWLSDRISVRTLIAGGAVAIAVAGLVCATTARLDILIAARFAQGACVPALTTCLAAYLARNLPFARLNVVMGSYVAATVLGGMFGRLLGGWVHPAAAWRHAFLSAALLVVLAAAATLCVLPRATATPPRPAHTVGYRQLLGRGEVWLSCLCGAAGQAVFSPVFNYMPYRLGEPLFGYSTAQTTLLYLVYLVGIVMGPGAGRLANRHGSGATLMAGAVILAVALLVLMLPSTVAIVLGLVGVCAGFFTLHAAAVGALNRKLSAGLGRANALYVLAYYLGAWFGVTWAGHAYQHGGWRYMLTLALILVTVPFSAGLRAHRTAQ